MLWQSSLPGMACAGGAPGLPVGTGRARAVACPVALKCRATRGSWAEYPVGGASHPRRALVQDVSVDHRREQ